MVKENTFLLLLPLLKRRLLAHRRWLLFFMWLIKALTHAATTAR